MLASCFIHFLQHLFFLGGAEDHGINPSELETLHSGRLSCKVGTHLIIVLGYFK